MILVADQQCQAEAIGRELDKIEIATFCLLPAMKRSQERGEARTSRDPFVPPQSNSPESKPQLADGCDTVACTATPCGTGKPNHSR
jgi:hypothetical protein